MTDACPMPRKATLQDTPHTMIGDMQRDDIHALDLQGCNVIYSMVRLNEFEREKPLGIRFDTWPETVRALHEREIAAWRERNPTAILKGMTQGVQDGVAVVALHWRPKA